MRILQVNTEGGWRGGERQTLYLSCYLREKGCSVTVLTRKGSPLEKKGMESGLEVVGVSSPLSAFLYLIREGKNFHILHAQNAHGHSLIVLSQPFHCRPTVYTRRVGFPIRGVFSRWKYRRTSQVVAISRFIQEEVKKVLPDRKVEWIPSVVVPRSLNSERALSLLPLEVSGRQYLLGTISSLTEEKDPFTLIQAISLLKKKREDFAFLHFGEGDLRPFIEKEIQKEKISHLYFLMGFVEDVEDIFSLLSLYIVSSRMEGLHSSVLDAFFYGVPVVATSVGGVREVVEGAGVLVPPGDPRSLADAIDTLLASSEKREECIKKGRERVEGYTLKVGGEKYLHLYRSLLER